MHGQKHFFLNSFFSRGATISTEQRQWVSCASLRTYITYALRTTPWHSGYAPWRETVATKKKWYRKTSYLEQPSRPFLSALHVKNDTTLALLAINLASQQKTTKLHFSSQVKKQFKLLAVPFKPLRCCLRNDKLWIAMFEKSSVIYF